MPSMDIYPFYVMFNSDYLLCFGPFDLVCILGTFADRCTLCFSQFIIRCSFESFFGVHNPLKYNYLEFSLDFLAFKLGILTDIVLRDYAQDWVRSVISFLKFFHGDIASVGQENLYLGWKKWSSFAIPALAVVFFLCCCLSRLET